MVSAKVKIVGATGLHLNAAGLLCDTAMQFKSKVTFKTDNNYEANAKSILSVLGASVKCGEEIELFCEGEDEEEALKTIAAAIKDGIADN